MVLFERYPALTAGAANSFKIVESCILQVNSEHDIICHYELIVAFALCLCRKCYVLYVTKYCILSKEWIKAKSYMTHNI